MHRSTEEEGYWYYAPPHTSKVYCHCKKNVCSITWGTGPCLWHPYDTDTTKQETLPCYPSFLFLVLHVIDCWCPHLDLDFSLLAYPFEYLLHNTMCTLSRFFTWLLLQYSFHIDPPIHPIPTNTLLLPQLNCIILRHAFEEISHKQRTPLSIAS